MLSKGAKTSQEDKIQDQVTFYLLYEAALLFKPYLFIDGNSQFGFPYQLLYYAWATCGKTHDMSDHK